MKALSLALIAAALFLSPVAASAQRATPAGFVNRVQAVPPLPIDRRQQCVAMRVFRYSTHAALAGLLLVGIVTGSDPDHRHLPWIAFGAGLLGGAAYGVYTARQECDLQSP